MSLEFYVTSRSEKWYVDEGNESHGPYLSQRDATADAIEAAERLATPKKAIKVLLKLPGSKWVVIWTSRKNVSPKPSPESLPDQGVDHGTGEKMGMDL